MQNIDFNHRIAVFRLNSIFIIYLSLDPRCSTVPEGSPMQLSCPDHMVISRIVFASFGNPTGVCGDLRPGICSYPHAEHLASSCINKQTCLLKAIIPDASDEANCASVATKHLTIQMECDSLLQNINKFNKALLIFITS